MNLSPVSDILFALGGRYSRLPMAFLHAMPLELLHSLRRPGCARRSGRPRARRGTATPSPRRGSTSGAPRRPEDLGGFFLTPELLKTRPEALLTGSPELAIESSGTSGHVTRVYLSRKERQRLIDLGVVFFTPGTLREGRKRRRVVDERAPDHAPPAGP